MTYSNVKTVKQLNIEELTMQLIDNDGMHPLLAIEESGKRLMIPVVGR